MRIKVDEDLPAAAEQRLQPAGHNAAGALEEGMGGWKTLVDIDSFSKWHPGVSEAKPDGPVAPGSHFYLKGGGITWNSTLQVVEPERCIGWTGTAVGAQTVP